MDLAYITVVAAFLLPVCVGQDPETTTFEVKMIPYAVVPFPVKLGESRVFSCSVSVTGDQDQTPVIKWFINDVEVTDTAPPARVLIESREDSQMLRLNEIQDDDGGIYKCEATLAGQADSKFITVEVTEPLKLHSPLDQFGILGSNGEVKCEVSGKPTPSIVWKFENGTKIPNTAKHVIRPGMLEIIGLTFDDDQVYYCDIVVPQTGETMPTYIKYEVVELPSIPMPPTIQPNNAKVGDTVKITCRAEGVPPPSYEFKHSNKLLPESQVDEVNGILTLTDLKHTNQGEYTCVATNRGGYKESSTTLDVKVSPVIDELQNVDDAVEGGNIKVGCTARGDPAPSIKWTKVTDDGGLDDGFGSDGPKFETVGDSAADAEIKVVGKNMIFNPVKYQDAGTYQCTAFNVVGNVTKTLTLHVKYKPTFDTDYKEKKFYGWEGHRVNMTCQVKANELALIEWHHPNEAEPNNFNKTTAISNDQIYTVETQQNFPEYHLSSASLLVRVGLDDTSDINVYKNYVCRAVNLQGKSYQVVSLVEAKVPGQPLVSVVNTLSTMVTVQIEPPRQEISQPITSYTYSYHPDGNTAQTEQATVERTGAITTVELRNLEPSTSYLLRVSAKNVVGPGSEQSLTIATKAVSSPLRMNIVSQQEGDAANSYLLRWQDPDDGGSPITHFIIKYKEVEAVGDEPVTWTIAGDVDAEFTEATEANPKSLSYRLSNLNSDSFYDVRIQAVNSLGRSDEAYILIKTSKGDREEEDDEKNDDEEKGIDEGEEKEDKDVDKVKEEANASGSSPSHEDGTGSAGLGSGGVIGIIIGLIILILVIVIVVYLITKKKPELVGRLRGRLGGKGGEEERGKKDDGKDPAEEEKLIKKEDTVKVENETEGKTDQVIEEQPEEFEPDNKPETPSEPAAVREEATDKPEELATPASAPTTEIKITPETPEKPENPPA